MPKKPADGHKVCVQCKRELPLSQYLQMPRGWKVNACNNCAGENMAAYWKGRFRWEPRKGYNPADHVKERAD